MTETEKIYTALRHSPDGVELILVWDLNVKLSHSEGKESDKDLAVILVVDGME